MAIFKDITSALHLTILITLFIRGIETQDGIPSWSDLQVQTKAIGTMAFRDYRIYIYEGVDALKSGTAMNRRQYFCTPIALLLPQSAKYKHLVLEGKHVVNVKVQLWSQQVQERVVDYMNAKMNMSVDTTQVTPINFEQIILTCPSAANTCKCPVEWQPYHLHNDRTFRMFCPSEAKALELENVLKSDPEQFVNAFKIKFNLATRNTQRKETAINVQNVISGNLFTELDQRFPESNEVYLTAEDTKELLSQSANNVVVESFTENDVISEGNEAAIAKVLENLMVMGNKRIDSESKNLWNSVFWRYENYRPDRVASELNELHNKSDTEKQKRLVAEVNKANKHSSDIGQLKNLAKSVQEMFKFKKEVDEARSGARETGSNSQQSSDQVSKGQSSQANKQSLGAKVGFSGWGATAEASLDVNKESSSSSNREDEKRSSSSSGYNNKEQEEKRNRDLTDTDTALSTSDSNNLQRNVKKDEESAHSETSENDDRDRAYGESLAKTAWTGEKFVAKPMTFTRINLSKVRNAQTYKDLKVSVTFSSANLTMSVNVDLGNETGNDYSLYSALEAKVAKLERRLTDIEHIRSSVDETRSEMQNVMASVNSSIATYFSSKERIFFFARTFLDIEGKGKRVTYGHSMGHRAMDTRTGTFTAPRDGTYAFFFNALKKEADTAVSIMRNDKEVTSMHYPDNGQVSISAVLTLKKGERVAVYLQFGKLKGNGWKPYPVDLKSTMSAPLPSVPMQFTAFSGFSID